MDLRRDRVDARLNGRDRVGGRRTGLAVIGAIAGLLVVRSSWNASRLDQPERWWAVAAVVLVSAGVAVALVELRELLPRPGDVPLVVGVVLGAIYLCVPETDQIPLVAAAVVTVVLIEAIARWRFPLVVIGALAAWVMWAGVFGATGRQSALIGTLVAWWPVAILPLVARLPFVARPSLASTGNWTRGVVVGIGAVAAVVTARTGALAPTAGPAVWSAAAAVSVSLAAAALWAVLRTGTSSQSADATP